MDDVVEMVLRTSADPWAYVVLLLLIVADGLVPLVPSETTTVAFAAMVRSAHPELLWVLFLTAWAGAWIGDNLAFLVGHNRWLRASRLLKAPRISKALHWAHTRFAERGAVIIVIARFLPVFRVAVNITAGMAGVRWSRFLLLSGVTAAVWCTYIVGSGWVAGHWFRHHPVLALLGAATVSAAVGYLVDKVAQRIVLRRHPGEQRGMVEPAEPYREP